jgi:hypothetical protein
MEKIGCNALAVCSCATPFERRNRAGAAIHSRKSSGKRLEGRAGAELPGALIWTMEWLFTS